MKKGSKVAQKVAQIGRLKSQPKRGITDKQLLEIAMMDPMWRGLPKSALKQIRAQTWKGIKYYGKISLTPEQERLIDEMTAHWDV